MRKRKVVIMAVEEHLIKGDALKKIGETDGVTIVHRGPVIDIELDDEIHGLVVILLKEKFGVMLEK